VHETLENRGILGQLRARIRAEVFSALNDPTDSRPEVSRENFLINELIREYLDFNHYKYASSVLVAGLYVCHLVVYLQRATKLALQAIRLSVHSSHSGMCQNEGTQKDAYSLPGSPVSSFLTPRMVDGDDPVRVKFEYKEVDPCENSS